MRILVTNDDGIDSEGLAALARRLSALADVTVAAPDREYSGSSASLGVLGEMRPEVRRVAIDGVADAWAVTGPPALCVLFATLGVFGAAYDLVVSGINPGANVGRAVCHSGTVGAALTARARGLPAVAVSQSVEGFGVEGQAWAEMLKGLHWDAAAEVAATVAAALLGGDLSRPLIVNLNVPNCDVEQMAGWERTTVGRVPPRVIADTRLEPIPGHTGAYRAVMEWGDAVSLPAGTDGGAIERDRVSMTFLGHLADVDTPLDTTAEESAWPAVAAALDGLLGAREPAPSAG